MFVDIPGSNKHKDLVCRMKCVKEEFASMEECEETCPLKCMTVNEKIKCQQDMSKPKEEEK